MTKNQEPIQIPTFDYMLGQPSMMMDGTSSINSFCLCEDDGTTKQVPFNTANNDYRRIKIKYDLQKERGEETPFNFDFDNPEPITEENCEEITGLDPQVVFNLK